MSASTEKVLEFIKANQGIVLLDWALNPLGTTLCRAVFNTPLKKRLAHGVKSPFIHAAINFFYPDCLNHEMSTALFVKMEHGKEFLIVESNLEPKSGVFDKRKLEFPSYVEAKKGAALVKFIGVPDILVQVKP